ncbi:hypothetical protein OG558_20740 [Kribbella sp. NBC_01510]
MRLSSTSYAVGSKECTWASACRYVAFPTPVSRARRAAAMSIGDERSTPSAVPDPASQAAARVVLPVPQPTSST